MGLKLRIIIVAAFMFAVEASAWMKASCNEAVKLAVAMGDDTVTVTNTEGRQDKEEFDPAGAKVPVGHEARPTEPPGQ